MSSQSVLSTSLLRLPDGQEIEIVVLRRLDGTIVVREAAELELELAREKRLEVEAPGT